MARTNKALNSIHNSLRDDGYLFERFGKSVISLELLEAMNIWERLARGETASVGEIKKMYTYQLNLKGGLSSFLTIFKKMTQLPETMAALD